MKRRPGERLQMNALFNHPWMQRMAKFYDLEIKDYIFGQQNDKQREMLSQSLKLE